MFDQTEVLYVKHLSLNLLANLDLMYKDSFFQLRTHAGSRPFFLRHFIYLASSNQLILALNKNASIS